MPRTIRPLAVALALLTVGLPAAAEGPTPPPKAYIDIRGGSSEPLPFALAPWKLDSGAPGSWGADVRAVIRRDLELSGWFQWVDEKAFLEPAGAGVRPGEFKFEDWRVSGTVGLAKGLLTGTGVTASIELHVFDVNSGQELLARRFDGSKADPRSTGHRIADAILEAFTGRPGFFSTRIATVANFGSGKEIFAVDADGSNPVPISRNGSINLSPAWSPDGSRISYTSYRDNNPDLWVTDLATMRPTKVSAQAGINVGAEWSPSGREIAITLSKDGDSDIYVIDPQGGVLRRLTQEWGIDVSPTWSPDGAEIAFCSSRNGNPQIFLMDAQGGGLRQLTHLGGHNVSPAFSPDGTQIAFAGRDEGRFDIFVMNRDGSGLRRLTQNGADDEDPTWSPTGSHIAFSSTRDGRGKQLYIMTADGSRQQRLTDGTGSYSNPQWGGRARQ
jgi:TolB protein